MLHLLSNMYLYPPSREALQSWKGALHGDIPDILVDLETAVDAIDFESKEQLDDLLWDYTRLFIGPYKLPCPPWESVYTSREKLLMQDAYVEVQAIYRKTGLTLNDEAVMSDHIGVELNFLGILHERVRAETDGMDPCAVIANSFLDEHLLEWVPQFTRDMERAADSPLYKSLAEATGAALRHARIPTGQTAMRAMGLRP